MNTSFNNTRASFSAPAVRHVRDAHDAQAYHQVAEAGEAAALEGTGAESVPGSRGEGFDEDSLKMWWRRIHQYPLLSAEREVELARRIEAGDEDAFNEMVESNLRLVGSIARKCRRHAGTSLSLVDLIQEGNCGLMRAVRKFDYRRGYKFSTYASYWIRQAVMRSIDEQSRSIRLPVHMVESMSRTDRARAALTQKLERPPTERELATHLEISEHKVQDIAAKLSEPISLDIGMGDADESVLMDFIEDKAAPSPVDCASRRALREEIDRAFDYLSQREVEVLTLRYGLGGTGQSRTLDEVGAHLGLTRERIRQIEKMALKRLKRSGPLRETAQGFCSFSLPPIQATESPSNITGPGSHGPSPVLQDEAGTAAPSVQRTGGGA